MLWRWLYISFWIVLCGKWATGFYANCHIWAHMYSIACVCNVDECGHSKKSGSKHAHCPALNVSFWGGVGLRVLLSNIHQAHPHFSAVELAVPSAWHAAPHVDACLVPVFTLMSSSRFFPGQYQKLHLLLCLPLPFSV